MDRLYVHIVRFVYTSPLFADSFWPISASSQMLKFGAAGLLTMHSFIIFPIWCPPRRGQHGALVAPKYY